MGADTLLNIASCHLSVALTSLEERKAEGSTEIILAEDFVLADANIDDLMSLILPLLPQKSLRIAIQVLQNQQLIHFPTVVALDIYTVNGIIIPATKVIYHLNGVLFARYNFEGPHPPISKNGGFV